MTEEHATILSRHLVLADGCICVSNRRRIPISADSGETSAAHLRKTTRLLDQRDLLRRSLGSAWPQAVATAAGRWIFDFLCLYAALLAAEARPPLYVALLAYSAAQLLGQLPLTPGGLGVVEAGLAGSLALAGVPAASAALATLAYRLASFWLPLPVGLVAWIWHRRRYGTRSA